MNIIERRESTKCKDSNGKLIRRWDWIRFVYYDGNRCAVAGGDGPVMWHDGEWAVIQVCPYEVICTPLIGITAAAASNMGMDLWVEGWIDVPDAPHGLWKPLKHTGPRPTGSEVG